jgi:hypothetical protein
MDRWPQGFLNQGALVAVSQIVLNHGIVKKAFAAV